MPNANPFGLFSHKDGPITHNQTNKRHEVFEEQKLSEQEIARIRLQETLMRCIGNKASENSSLAWHPSRYENYYLAKFAIQLGEYTKQYGALNEVTLTANAAQSVAEEKRELVIAQVVEKRHALEEHKTEHSPAKYQRQQQKK